MTESVKKEQAVELMLWALALDRGDLLPEWAKSARRDGEMIAIPEGDAAGKSPLEIVDMLKAGQEVIMSTYKQGYRSFSEGCRSSKGCGKGGVRGLILQSGGGRTRGLRNLDDFLSWARENINPVIEQ